MVTKAVSAVFLLVVTILFLGLGLILEFVDNNDTCYVATDGDPWTIKEFPCP